jgi:hypothetical protein
MIPKVSADYFRGYLSICIMTRGHATLALAVGHVTWLQSAPCAIGPTEAVDRLRLPFEWSQPTPFSPPLTFRCVATELHQLPHHPTYPVFPNIMIMMVHVIWR